MGIRKFISVLLIFVLMTEIILGASSAYSMDMPLKGVVAKEIDTASQNAAASELSRKISEYITNESLTAEKKDNAVIKPSEENSASNESIEDVWDKPNKEIADMPVSSLLNLNAPPEDENTGDIKSKFTISGYIAPDFTSSFNFVNAGFKVEILGTDFSSITDDTGYFVLTGRADSQTNYILQITKTGFLKRQIYDLTLKGILSVGAIDNPVKMWAGDIPKNGVQDDTINMSDVILIAVNFGRVSGSGQFNKSCDLNGDNSINMSDVIIMARHFNSTPASYDVAKVNAVIDDEKPSVPQNLKALWNTGASISLEWQAATDNISVDRYEIYCNDKLIAVTKETSLVCSGMTPKELNKVYIKAVDSSENMSDSSNILEIQAPEDDHGDSKENATPIELVKEISGTMTDNKDADYFTFVPKTSGVYVYKEFNTLVIDNFIYDSDDNEIVSSNNEYYLEAGKKYYLKLVNVFTLYYSFTIRPKASKPDLVINGISTKKAYLGQPVNIEVNLLNIGDVDCTGSFRIMLDVDEQKNVFWADVDSDVCVDLNKKILVTGGINGSKYWVPDTLGKHTIRVHVDYGNSIPEINENNTYEYQFIVDESNDNYENAKEMVLDSEIDGELYQGCGEDYYYFIPPKNAKYRFEMPNPKDAIFYMYDKNKANLVATSRVLNEAKKLLYCYVECELAAGEKYYISAKGYPKGADPNEKYKIILYDATPDLIIEGVSPLNIMLNSDSQPYVYIKNEGLGDLIKGNGFRVKVDIKELNKTVYTEYYRDTLRKGDVANIALDSSLYKEVSSKKGTYNLHLSIEKEKDFFETDYANNTTDVSLNVGNADLVVSEIITPYDSVVNNPLDLRVKVANFGLAETNGLLPIKAVVTLNGNTYYTDEYIGKIKPYESVTLAVYDSNKMLPVIGVAGEHEIKADVFASDKSDDGRKENNSLLGKLMVDKMPDLTVKEIRMTPSDLSQGDEVKFSAYIKNIGEGQIGNNKVIRVGFKIDDGDSVYWSDNYSSGLKPGEEVKLTCNKGIGSDKWFAQDGEHTITAIVDDLGCFTESDEINNTLTEKFVVKGKCDLRVESIILDPPNPIAGEKVVLRAQVINVSDSGSPFGRLHKVGFKINDGANIIWADSFRGTIEGKGSYTFATDRDKNSSLWMPMAEGSFKITAFVDEHNEISEIDELNNKLDKTVKVTKDRIFDEEDDYDNDGIKNGVEKNIGTDWNNQDTDNDSISDGDEVNGKGFVTDPLNPDTDEDGVFDGAEIKLGKSPIVKDEYTPFLAEARTQSDSVVVEVYGSGSLEACPIKINELDNFIFKSTEGIISNPVEVSLEGYNMQLATITFNYNELKLDGISEDDLTIYWVDYDNNVLVPLPDYDVSVDKFNNCITGRVSHFSTYVPGKKDMGGINLKKDTVFTIDESGSMDVSDDVKARTGIPIKIVGNIGEKDSNFAVVKFTEIVKRLINLTNDKNAIVTALNTGIGGGATDIKGGLLESEKILMNSSNRRYVLLLSDGGNNRYPDSEVIDTARRMAQENIRVFCISLGDDSSLLSEISDITEGSYFILDTSLKGIDLETEINDIAERLKDIIESEEDKPKEKKGPAKKIPSTIPNKTYGCINWAGDIDAYEFTPTETKLYCISSIGETDTEISVYDSKGKLLTSSDSNDDNMWDKNFYILMSLSKGEKYRFEVNHHDLLNGTGEYYITVSDPIKEKLGPDQAYLKLLAYEMKGTYIENSTNKTVDVSINGETHTFNKIYFVNGQVVVYIKDFLNAFGITEIYSAPGDSDENIEPGDVPRVISEVGLNYNTDDIENIEKVQNVLSKLGCLNEVIAALYREMQNSSRAYGFITMEAVKKFQIDFMGKSEKTANGKVDKETAIALDEYLYLYNINPSYLKAKGVNVRAYLENVYKLTSANRYYISYDGKNIVITDIKDTSNGKQLIFIPDLYFSGKENRCYAKVRNIKYAYKKFNASVYCSQEVYNTKVNMLKLMGNAMKARGVFVKTDITNSLGSIDGYWDDKFEVAANNYVRAALLTESYSIFKNSEYSLFKNKDIQAMFLKHWTGIELKEVMFYCYPAPADWYAKIPEPPVTDVFNGTTPIKITENNKDYSNKAREYYHKYVEPLDKIRNWMAPIYAPNGLFPLWLQTTYGISEQDKGGILGGIFDSLEGYPRETIAGIMSALFAIKDNPKAAVEVLAFLFKALSGLSIYEEEQKMLRTIIVGAISAYVDKFINETSYNRGKMIGTAIANILSLFISGGKAISVFVESMDILKGAGMLSEVMGKLVTLGKTKGPELFLKTSEAVKQIISCLRKTGDELFDIVSQTAEKGTKILFKMDGSGIEVLIEKAYIRAQGILESMLEFCITGCFTGETKVLTNNGLVSIDSLNKGDYVFATDVETGASGYKKILQVERRSSNELVILNIEGRIVRTTPRHLFYMADGSWQMAGLLKTGDSLLDADGNIKKVVSVKQELLLEPEKIYNLNIEDYHTYYVSEMSVLVHNIGCPKIGDMINDVAALGKMTVAELTDLASLLKAQNYSRVMLRELLDGIKTGTYTLENVTDLTRIRYKISMPSTGTVVYLDKYGKVAKFEYIVGSGGVRGSGYSRAIVPKGAEKGHIKSVFEGAKDNCIEDSPFNIIAQMPDVNDPFMKAFEVFRRDNCKGMVTTVDILGDGYVRVRIPDADIDITYNPLSRIAKDPINGWARDWYKYKGRIWD
ncbi:MAG TPA: CARDB domain-containing protein [Pseudobacteroides sp.]|uniref:CARDB domain-containing protein n=1 Tax=Pseudobacteroides sp. TaxID=1968840 RepID=UPI002F95C936